MWDAHQLRPLMPLCVFGYGNTWVVWQAWLQACTFARATSHSTGNGSAASAGGSPFTGGGPARYNDVDEGLPWFFGMIAERDAKSFASRGMVINDLDIDQDKRK